MYIKKSLFVLTLVSLCSASYAAEEKSKLSRIFSFITSPVVAGPTIAAGITAAEDGMKKESFEYLCAKVNIEMPNTFETSSVYRRQLPMHGAGPVKDMVAMRSVYRTSDSEIVKGYLRNDLTKTFYKYAFYRNLALVWGGMHLYHTYKGTKKETYR